MRDIHYVPRLSDIPHMIGGARGRTQFATFQAHCRTFQLAILMRVDTPTDIRVTRAYRTPEIIEKRQRVAARAREYRRNRWPFPEAPDAAKVVRRDW